MMRKYMSKLRFEVPNYYHLAPRNYGKARSEYPQVIDYLENEIHTLYLIIDRAIKCIEEDYEKYYGDDLLDEYQEIVNILKGKE